MKKFFLPLAAAVMLAVAAAMSGAGSGDGNAASSARALKLGIVTDIGGLNDRGFNSLANKGRLRADKLSGVSTRVLISRSPSDYIPNLTRLARENYNLIIGVGFLMTEQVGQVARRYPNIRFAVVDGPVAVMGDPRPTNAQGLIFREAEAGCLVGDLAARAIGRRGGGNQIISAVGGIKVPAVDAFIAGYRYCARRVNRRIQVRFNYAASFTDVAKCKEVALNQIAAGSQVVFQVAGQCGLGALSAARERRVWGIGVDADQGYLGPHVLTSALKKVDVAVFKTAQAVRNGRFRGGRDVIFSVRDRAVGLGKVSRRLQNRRALVAQTMRTQRLIRTGRLKLPTKL